MTTDKKPGDEGFGLRSPGESPRFGGSPNTPERVDLNLDLTELPDGRYFARVAQVNLAFGRESNKPYFDVEFVIEEPEAYADRSVWSVLSFAPRALRWTIQRLNAIAGYDLPPTKVNVADPTFRDQFVGRRVVLRIGSRAGRGGWMEPDVLAVYSAPEQVESGES